MRKQAGWLLSAMLLTALGPTIAAAHCGSCGMGDDAKAGAAAMGDPAARMKEKLGLTDEQAAQIKPIMEEKHQKMMQLHEEYKTKIDAVLTPEQKAKFDEMKAGKAKGMGCEDCPMCAGKGKGHAHGHSKSKKSK